MTDEPNPPVHVPATMRPLICSLALAAFAASPLALAAPGEDLIVAEAKLREALPLPLIPLPREAKVTGGETDFAGAKVGLPASADGRVARAGVILKEAFGAATNAGVSIRLILDAGAGENPEGYALTIDASGATVRAATPAGLIHGATTLAQMRGLAGTTKIPRVEIRDEPALAFRAVMHDIGRSYMTPERIRRQIEIFARYKINVFHWHLTENPAWRFEVKSHPELTRAEFHDKERAPGKFYTQAEIREVIAFAKARGVTVMPEIDIPGHTAALRRALGVKRMDDPKVAPVLRDAFRELLALASPEDMPYIHMGSDEAHTPEEQLPQAFMDEIAAMIHKSGRKVVMWSPGKRPPAGANTLEMLWAQAKPNGRNPFIDARSIYTNLNTGFDAVRTTYWNVPATDGKAELRFGAGLAQWLDLPTLDENIERVSPFWPALVTFADRAWHGGAFREDLLVTLPPEGSPEARAAGNFDAAVVAHRDAFFKGTIFPYIRDEGFWRLLGPVPNGGKRDTAFGPEKDFLSVASVKSGDKEYGWDKTARGAQVFVRHMFGWPGAIDAAKPKTDPWAGGIFRWPNADKTTVYARAVIASDADREVGFWIQIDPPNASDRRDGPNPKRGQWNNDGAKIWINGAEVAPPAWKTPGQGAAGGPDKFRVALSDEFFFMRPAIPVKLKKGDNVVLLRLPSGGKKWEFTCTPVEWDGVNAREVKGVSFRKW